MSEHQDRVATMVQEKLSQKRAQHDNIPKLLDQHIEEVIEEESEAGIERFKEGDPSYPINSSKRLDLAYNRENMRQLHDYLKSHLDAIGKASSIYRIVHVRYAVYKAGLRDRAKEILTRPANQLSAFDFIGAYIQGSISEDVKRGVTPTTISLQFELEVFIRSEA